MQEQLHFFLHGLYIYDLLSSKNVGFIGPSKKIFAPVLWTRADPSSPHLSVRTTHTDIS